MQHSIFTYLIAKSGNSVERLEKVQLSANKRQQTSSFALFWVGKIACEFLSRATTCLVCNISIGIVAEVACPVACTLYSVHRTKCIHNPEIEYHIEYLEYLCVFFIRCKNLLDTSYFFSYVSVSWNQPQNHWFHFVEWECEHRFYLNFS